MGGPHKSSPEIAVTWPPEVTDSRTGALEAGRNWHWISMKNKNLFLTIYDILWYSVMSVQEVMWGSSGVPLRGLSQCERRIGRLFQWLVWLVALAPQGEAEKFSQILWRFNTLKSLSKITSSETCVIPDCQVVSCVRSVSSSNNIFGNPSLGSPSIRHPELWRFRPFRRSMNCRGWNVAMARLRCLARPQKQLADFRGARFAGLEGAYYHFNLFTILTYQTCIPDFGWSLDNLI